MKNHAPFLISLPFLAAFLLPAGCGGEAASDPPVATRETCAYRASDRLPACITLKSLAVASSPPNVQAGQLKVGSALVYSPRAVGDSYHEAKDPQWDPGGKWVIYTLALHQIRQSEFTVGGYNAVTKEQWSATPSFKGSLSISAGRVHWAPRSIW